MELAAEHGILLSGSPAECWMGVPVVLDNVVKGVIVLQSYNNPNAYNEGHISLMEMVAQEMAKVMQRAEMIQNLINAKNKAEESERLKGAFLSNMSHEIRTPLNSIMGFLQYLKHENPGEQERQHYYNVIMDSGNRLLNTINDIVEVSKIDSGQISVNLQNAHLGELINEVQRTFEAKCAQKGLTFIFNRGCKDEDKIVKIDSYIVGRVVSNLINNAIKFTEKGHVEVGCNMSDNMLNVYIKDTGAGIPEDKLDTIFRSFQQADSNINRKYEGSGLGLAIVKGYVNLLKGEIRVESKPGAGSTFYVSFPYQG